ncbi:Golgi complex component 7-domain-containing protein [Armillaria novae-zelandiae]|uniref:Conserved oligomeric Golgi complex subunit 7 n=1 Tax=Armillaria novae-zelandiae TaxID=153914 RepID=A0AA39TFH0_9AGAR|nr:Golgi complex component 7-domain-containing protein [Armillaria novae-zelandiae]
MTANARLARNLEYHFGPPSEPVHIADFISSDIPHRAFVDNSDTDDFSVSDIHDVVGKAWDNPELSAYIIKKHDAVIDALYATQNTTKTRRKIQNTTDGDDSEDSLAVLELNKALQSIRLSSYPLCSEASLFVRPPKNSDQNALDKRKPSESNDSPSSPDDARCALITVTIYTKGSSTTMRMSQHAFLSSQALGDIIETMPCASNDLPKEISSHGQVATELAVNASSGSVVCIEDVLYGDGMNEIDYADKMLQWLATQTMKDRALTKAPESIIPAIWSIVGDLRLGESPCILCGPCWENMGEPEDGVVVVPFPQYELGCIYIYIPLLVPTMTVASSSTVHALDTLSEYDDVISWINDTLPTSEDREEDAVDLAELEQHITQLLASLDIASEDTSSQLERTVRDVSRAVPRLTYDLHFMKDGALTLQSGLLHVRSRAKAAVPLSTQDALDKLHLFDTMKSHMEAAREVLREAESWSTLEIEVTSLLSDHNYSKAAARLSEASRSMVVFQNTPEYDPRRALMVNLQNQLEASLSSALVAAINVHDLAACKSYFSIFSDIQREHEFRNYYNGSRKAEVVAFWQNAQLLDCGGEGTMTFVEFLPKFYEHLLSILNLERASMSFIFPDPAVSLSALISSVLSALQPTFSQRLTSLFNHYGDSVLKTLISLFKMTEDFAAAAEKITEKIKHSTPSMEASELPSSNHVAHKRRRSMRMSMSWRNSPAHSSSNTQNITKLSSLLEWEQELFQPFLDFQVEYASLERRFLDENLRHITKNDGVRDDTDADGARLLRERAVDVFGAADESVTRCVAFTHGYGAVGLVQALDGFFKSFVDMRTDGLRITSSPSGTYHSTEEGLSGLDYTPQDWAEFQHYLHLLSSTRSVFERLLSFENKLRASLAQISTAFRLSREDPITFGSNQSQLLSQSTLHSPDLHTLLESRPTDPLLVEARAAVYLLARTCQECLQRTILSPLMKPLSGYASLPVWNALGNSKSQKLFEVYVDDDALSFSLHTLPHIDEPEIPLESQPAYVGHARRQSTSRPLAQGPSPELVSSAWLSSLSRTLLTHLTTEVLPAIPALSQSGSAQLSSDLGYLSNIVRAINVEFDDLERWRTCIDSEDGGGVQDMVWKEVNRMRGVKRP